MDIKISQLPVASSASNSDQIPANQSGTTRSITVAQILSSEVTARLVQDLSLQAQITANLASGASLTSPTFIGVPAAPTAAPGTSTTQLATTAFATTADLLRLRITGADTMTGALNMGTNKINNLTNGTSAQDAVSLSQMQAADNLSIRVKEGYDPTATGAYPTTYNGGAIPKGASYNITVAGVITIAGTALTLQVGDTLEALVITPANVHASWLPMQSNNIQASTTVIGISRLATDAEAKAEALTTVTLTPSNLAALGSTTTQTGIIALATQTEVNTGIDNTKAVTPATLAGRIGGGLIQTSLPLTTAQLATLNSVPIQLVSAPGAGYAIEVVSASVKYTYSTNTFTGTQINLFVDTAVANQMVSPVIQSVAASTFCRLAASTSAAITLVANKALMIKCDADGAGAGAAGTAIVYINYRIITI